MGVRSETDAGNGRPEMTFRTDVPIAMISNPNFYSR
ncbi:hypothetical protein FDG2_2559 [Candidatus Protofrankia californiensis]|uniref:Uncharacterized protein n=1 Tax=Candidatus Protofrankia californiensis TaxID=1839754 RepID=A0A1C3NXW4_9ACTN|nr:hypothetical protein FDG2_2559 [Candidatus Protofrankia californiensis]